MNQILKCILLLVVYVLTIAPIGRIYALEDGIGKVDIAVSVTYDNVYDLEQAFRSANIASISNNDFVSIILDKIHVVDDVTDDPRVLEVQCELEPYSGKSITYTTVFKEVIEEGTGFYEFNQYKTILSNIPLKNIKDVKIKVVARPIDDDNVEIFEAASKLVINAASGTDVIKLFKVIAPPSRPLEPKDPEFNAIFRVASNFLQFQRLNQNNFVQVPFLEPDKKVSILWKHENHKLPKDVVSNIINAVLGAEYIKDYGDVAGYITITPTKRLLAPVNAELQRKLKSIWAALNEETEDRFKKVEKMITQVRASANTIYTDFDDPNRGAVHYYLKLAEIYNRYLSGEADKIAPSFANWVESQRNFVPLYGFDQVFVSNLYSKKPAKGKNAIFIFPK